ncbi:MAG: ribosome small subunit-dependent GTPase A [Clostridiaceae bacterium]
MEGIIIKGIGGLYTIKDGDKILEAKPRGIFRKRKISPLPGDRVTYSMEGNTSMIEDISVRKNELIRPAVANVTRAWMVFSIKDPDLNLNLLYTFLLVMEEKNIEPLILFNKSDISDEKDIKQLESIFSKTPYEYKFIIAKNSLESENLKKYLNNELTILCGPSGAGKSTILNNIVGESKMVTGEVSAKIGRGKHTTRHTELVEVSGGLLADTPGFSNIEFKTEDHRDLRFLFPEFQSFEGQCRFNGCLHHKEPGCSVKEQVGITISESRYGFYIETLLKLIEGEKYKWN